MVAMIGSAFPLSFDLLRFRFTIRTKSSLDFVGHYYLSKKKLLCPYCFIYFLCFSFDRLNNEMGVERKEFRSQLAALKVSFAVSFSLYGQAFLHLRDFFECPMNAKRPSNK